MYKGQHCLSKELLDPDINEVYLFHGTKVSLGMRAGNELSGYIVSINIMVGLSLSGVCECVCVCVPPSLSAPILLYLFARGRMRLVSGWVCFALLCQ